MQWDFQESNHRRLFAGWKSSWKSINWTLCKAPGRSCDGDTGKQSCGSSPLELGGYSCSISGGLRLSDTSAGVALLQGVRCSLGEWAVNNSLVVQWMLHFQGPQAVWVVQAGHDWGCDELKLCLGTALTLYSCGSGICDLIHIRLHSTPRVPVHVQWEWHHAWLRQPYTILF